ncbi:small subunit processome component 20 homolog isoform X2 [Aplysia californica]|uniref:Small subunit processome component 20 homolog isoform X2 n=1 Tax=Aplysia californica TaxID=6500 RepID=A0ABM0JAQ7_APLCA|nr:small subunit processome component 20 homolog isoform X2 [Aplysia californica]
MGKSSKHKTQNVHHFISFSERISNVNVDVIHLIRKVHDDQGEAGTYFGEALSKWTDLDLTDHFTSFRREISGQVQTFEQLVHHKEEIISSLKSHLAVKNSLALNALLDLLVQLARDLQQDFVPHFSEFFHLLVATLTSRSQDVEALESTFQAFAFLFRVLWRFLIKDFEQIFGYFSNLLTSQKEYVRVFAAESCAYLLRKVKKRNALLNFLFKSLKKNPELTEGVGFLLFEMMKGVKFHFHSVCDEIFPLMLNKLGSVDASGKKNGLPLVAVEEAVSVVMQKCADHTSREHSGRMWDMLMDALSTVHSSCLKNDNEVLTADQAEHKVPSNVQHLCRLLRLTSVWLSHDGGSIVGHPEQVAKVLLVILRSVPRPDSVGQDLLDTVSNLFTSCDDRLAPDMIVKLTSAVFSDAFTFSSLKEFVRATLERPFFEKDILPGCMNRIHFELPMRSPEQQQDVLAFIGELVMVKTGSPVTGGDLHMLKRYPLDQITYMRSSKENCFCKFVADTLASTLENSDPWSPNELSLLWGAVVCAPHLSIPDSLGKVGAVWSRVVGKLKSCEHSEDRQRLAIVVNQLVRSMLMIQEGTEEPIPVTCDEIMDVLGCDPSSPTLLQTADLFFSQPSSSVQLTSQQLVDVYKLLEQNLVSPSHTVRLLSCHLLSLFPVELPDYNDDVKRENVFTTLWTAEKMVPTVHNYREKLIYLRRLEHGMVLKCLPEGPFTKAPLLFLLGNQHWNFKLLWEPLAEIISSHAIGADVGQFWEVMLGQLRLAANQSEKELLLDAPTSESDQERNKGPLLSLFDDHLSAVLTDARKPDFINFRVQLWRCMKKFPDKCVLRSDELCTLYLTFLRNEFHCADGESQMYQNILSDSPAETAENHEGSDDNGVEVESAAVDEEMEEEDEDVNDQGNKTTGKRKKPTTLSLLVHLDLFALFKKQRSMFNKPEVQDTFHQLLKNRNSSIQKAAFECLVTYKSPHILPYRENFNRLLDDKTFKSEIILFRVDEENSEVKDGDRDGLLPVLMRILYGKMHGKAGNDTAGTSRSRVRKSIVFGFLSGCKPDELRYFLTLLFQPCMHFVTDDPVTMVKTTMENTDLKKMIPLKKIKGVLNTVHTVLQKQGHHLEGFTHPLLHMLLGLAALLSSVLDMRTQVVKGAINLLKSLRHTVVLRITEFLEYYEDLDFTAQELDALFQAVVWPAAEKLVLEGVHHPTPLLKLFVFWSRSNRLVPLLGHVKGSDFTSEITTGAVVTASGPSPFSCMFALLNAPAVSSDVAAAVLDIVLCVLGHEEAEEEASGDKTASALPGVFRASDHDERGLGEVFISPHVPELLRYLQKALSKLVNGSAGKKHTFILELKILASISRFVTAPSECRTLCDLLIPYLASSTTLPEDMEENTLTCVTNLLQHVDNPQVFYRQVSQLFCSVERRASRALLCKLFLVINKEDSSKSTFAETIEKMNSWDKRKAEEPDFTARLEAFHNINSLVSGQAEPDVNVLLPVVYNCCYFIHAVDDLSIRDNSTHCLTSIVERLASCPSKDNKAFNVVIEKCLVGQVKLGIRSKSEAVRHEYLTVLQSLVKHYPAHQLFAGLSLLSDKDPEADFFENIRHIQIHKRSRALRRLYKHLKDHRMNPDIHMTYFIPLVYAFITDPSYAKHASVQDAAVDLLGAICKQLPWQHYQRLLQFYLRLLPKRLETQRQIVRIIVALLDGFHFDLNKSTFKVHLSPRVKQNNSDEPDAGEKKEDLGSSLGTKDAETAETVGEEKAEDASMEDDDTLPPMEVMDTGTEELNMSTDQAVKEDVGSESSDGRVVCSVSAATRIHKTIVTSLLPALHRVITQKTKGEEVHKLAGTKYPEDEEILRVPIALAMIKLLQNLPKGTLENRLPGILLKICNFLKSRSRDVRTSARETLQKAALSLGARFFPFIVKELQAALTRGYQLHVLGFTVHYLMNGLQSIFSPGDLDPAVARVQSVFHNELFGQVAEEKEVAAIKAKYFEAKFVKAYEAYELLAKFISASSLNLVIKPVKEMLETTSSQRIANKAEMLLRKVADGLMANTSIPVETMMVFVHSLTTKLMDQIATSKEEKPVKDVPGARMPESCLLLKEAAPRSGFKPQASKKTNAHLVVEFGLQLLNASLKKSALLPTEYAHLQMLDPFVGTLRDCLTTSHVKTSAMAMRCLSWILKFPLPSLKENIEKISEGMFVVLQNYVGSALAKGGNQELVSMCFKAVTVLVRDVTFHQISRDQLQVLLTYCEEDLYNYSRQSTAFNLIRAILSRKLDIPQLHQVMEKLFEMSIVSPVSGLRLQSRQVLLFYMMNYPLGKDLKRHLFFYIDHLQYELEDGRESAIEMMISMFTNFPKKILNNHCPRFFTNLSMTSYNDSSLRCRKLVSVALRTLIGKIDFRCRKSLYLDVLKWMKSDDIRVRTMGCQVCGLFVEVEGGKFENRLEETVPLLQQLMDPGRFTKEGEEEEEEDAVTEQQDMCLLAVLNVTIKVARELNVARNPKLVGDLDLMWGHVLSHQLYPHAQVRLAACQLTGLFFSSWEPSEVTQLLSQAGQSAEVGSGQETDELRDSYFPKNCSSLVRVFGKVFCQQLQAPSLDDALATQVVKNLLYLGRLAEALATPAELVWLAKKIVREANHEVIHNVKVTVKRNYVFKWVAAVGVTLTPESVQSLLPIALPALQREMSENAKDEELKNLVQEVLDLLKKQVGVEAFTSAFATSHKWRAEKRDIRKRQVAAEAVTDPDIAARKKIRHHLKKKESKKRKIEERKPIERKRVKKSKLSILNVKVDID